MRLKHQLRDAALGWWTLLCGEPLLPNSICLFVSCVCVVLCAIVISCFDFLAPDDLWGDVPGGDKIVRSEI